MRSGLRLGLILAAFVVTGCQTIPVASPQTGSPAGAPPDTAAAAPVRAAICAGGPLEEFVWLAGSWAARSPGRIAEEHWQAPCGSRMLAVNRTVDASGQEGFEHIRLEARADGVAYIAAPGGGAPVVFMLVQSAENSAVFANDSHDFPQRISYLRQGDRLIATASGDTMQTWTFTRVAGN